jgi:hypothetical protein
VFWFTRPRDSLPPSSPLVTETPSEFRGVLPYVTDNYIIDYREDSGTYTVNIYAEPTERFREEASQWLRRHGADLERNEVVFFVAEEEGSWSDEE